MEIEKCNNLMDEAVEDQRLQKNTYNVEAVGDTGGKLLGALR